jgi:hypothetical protein
MTSQERALAGFASALMERRIPYMVVGGLANAVWGEPRATLDIDVTVWVEDRELARVIGELTSVFPALTTDPVDFVRKTRVLPLESGEGIRVDVIFGLLPFEREAIERSVPMKMAGVQVSFCTAEDLVLMKIVSARERDLADAKAIVLRRLRDLDLGYLEPRIAELAAFLAPRRDQAAVEGACGRGPVEGGHPDHVRTRHAADEIAGHSPFECTTC